MLVSEMTWDMFEDKPWIGWGAGSFRYKYHYYALSYPEIYFIGKTHWKRYGEFTMYYRQSHNDHFQFLAEYGVFGYGLLVLCGASWVIFSLYQPAFSFAWVMAIGVALFFLLHNIGDFFLQNAINLGALLILLCTCVGVGKYNAKISG